MADAEILARRSAMNAAALETDAGGREQEEPQQGRGRKKPGQYAHRENGGLRTEDGPELACSGPACGYQCEDEKDDSADGECGCNRLRQQRDGEILKCHIPSPDRLTSQSW